MPRHGGSRRRDFVPPLKTFLASTSDGPTDSLCGSVAGSTALQSNPPILDSAPAVCVGAHRTNIICRGTDQAAKLPYWIIGMPSKQQRINLGNQKCKFFSHFTPQWHVRNWKEFYWGSPKLWIASWSWLPQSSSYIFHVMKWSCQWIFNKFQQAHVIDIIHCHTQSHLRGFLQQ